jgi:hypothetical protein
MITSWAQGQPCALFFMPPAAKTLFKKRGLDSQKLSIHGACTVIRFAAVVPIGAVFCLMVF